MKCTRLLAAVFLPQLAERIAFADLFHNFRVVCQDHAATAFLRRPFQRPAQRRFVVLRAAQCVQDMYVVIIFRTGIRNVAGQHSFQLFRQNRFKVIGKNTDRAVIEQQGECVFHLAGRYHVARGDIHRQRYADRRIVRFQRDPDAGVIVGFPNVRDTDNLKLYVVGNLFRMGLVPSSYIPSKDIRILREFTRYRSKLVSMRSSEKNRFQNAFTVCNLTLDAVVSDMLGKSATDIENYLLDTDTVDPEHCVSLLRCSLKKKASDVVEAVSGFNMIPEQKERVRIVQGHFADIDHRIAQLDEIISNLVAEYEGQISLLPVTNPPGKRNPSEYPEPAFT